MFNHATALRSVLSPAYLEWALQAHYDIGTWQECRFWLRGLNDTYRVQTSTGVYILRVYRTEVAEADVRYELSVLTALKERLGSSEHTEVGDFIPTKDQTGYTMLDAAEGKRAAVIFNYIEGQKIIWRMKIPATLLAGLLLNCTKLWMGLSWNRSENLRQS